MRDWALFFTLVSAASAATGVVVGVLRSGGNVTTSWVDSRARIVSTAIADSTARRVAHDSLDTHRKQYHQRHRR
jgi:hypothetical protein